MVKLTIEEHSEAWHEIRRQNIGGSEIAGLFGLQPDYGQSAFTLHMVKSGRIPPPPVDDSPGSRIWFGTQLEPIIARMAAAIFGWQIEKGGYCLDDTTPGMACSQDYVILAPGPEERALGFEGPGNLQIKNIDALAHREKWVNGEPPYHILLQNQHEIACSGLSWGVIVGLVGGNRVDAYRYAARPKIIDMIRARVAEFWDGVGAGKPPLVDGSNSAGEAIRAMFPALADDEEVDLTSHNEAQEICAGWLVAKADRDAAAARFDEYNNRLKLLMEGKKRALATGFAIKGVFTPANEGTRAGDLPPDQIIGARKASYHFKVKELAA